MQKDDFKTLVVFRKFKNGGDIIALFPKELADDNGKCCSYQHIGQHGPADYNYCIQTSKPASPKEYEDLQKELEGLGYDLEIRKRYNRGVGRN